MKTSRLCTFLLLPALLAGCSENSDNPPDSGGGGDGGPGNMHQDGSASTGSGGAFGWARRLGGAGEDGAFAVTVDGDGNVLLAGLYSGQVDFGGGMMTAAGVQDLFVAKFKADGTYQWSRGFGAKDTRLNNELRIAADAAGNVVVSGNFSGTLNLGGGDLQNDGNANYGAFLARFDPQGTHLWSHRLGGSIDSRVRGLALDAGGAVLVAGYFGGGGDFGVMMPIPMSKGAVDLFLVRYKVDGSHEWDQHYGAAGNKNRAEGNGLVLDGSGNLLVGGSLSGTMDFGDSAVKSDGARDILVGKFKGDGSGAWARHFSGGPGSSNIASDVTADTAGNVAIAGIYNGTPDFGAGPLPPGSGTSIFLARFAPDGAALWSRGFGKGPGTGVQRGLATDGSGNLLLGAYFSGTIDLGGGTLASVGRSVDAVVAKYQPDGTPLWARRFGDKAEDKCYGVAADRAGNVLVVGSFQGTLDFGGGPLMSAGGRDAFLLKLGP